MHPWAALAPAILALAGTDAQDPAPGLEYRLKAKALKSMAFFTEFPGANAGRPWVIGVFGDSPLAVSLPLILPPGSLLKGRPVRFAFPKGRAEMEGLDILFIAHSEGARLDEVLGWVRGRPILTVGDTPGFLERGTMIHFAIEQDRIRPEVNLPAAERAGLKFDSFFLSNSKIHAR